MRLPVPPPPLLIHVCICRENCLMYGMYDELLYPYYLHTYRVAVCHDIAVVVAVACIEQFHSMISSNIELNVKRDGKWIFYVLLAFDSATAPYAATQVETCTRLAFATVWRIWRYTSFDANDTKNNLPHTQWWRAALIHSRQCIPASASGAI